jgi:hypothetical protein
MHERGQDTAHATASQEPNRALKEPRHYCLCGRWGRKWMPAPQALVSVRTLTEGKSRDL